MCSPFALNSLAGTLEQAMVLSGWDTAVLSVEHVNSVTVPLRNIMYQVPSMFRSMQIIISEIIKGR
jgi:hypothetical protein